MRPRFQNRPAWLPRQGCHFLAPLPLPSTEFFYKTATLFHFRMLSRKPHSSPHYSHGQEYWALPVTWVQPGGLPQAFTCTLATQEDLQNLAHEVLSESSLGLVPILFPSSGCLSQDTEAISPSPTTQSHSCPGTSALPSSWHDAVVPFFYKHD